MALIRRGSAKKKHEARLAWLSARPDLYRHVPGIHDDVTEAGSFALATLCGEMRVLKLFGHSTVAVQRETARRLVSELRGEHVGESW